jgi:hypothetical protein
MLLKVLLKGLMVDPVSKMPIVLLVEEKSEQVLPIWIGVFEANAIAVELEHIRTPRPMTHDLMRNLVAGMEGSVSQVAITDLSESTYYAVVTVRSGDGREIRVDARPSDAIALALRAKAPIFVEETVLQKSEGMTPGSPDESREERVRKWLESLDPEDLGKYEM